MFENKCRMSCWYLCGDSIIRNYIWGGNVWKMPLVKIVQMLFTFILKYFHLWKYSLGFNSEYEYVIIEKFIHILSTLFDTDMIKNSLNGVFINSCLLCPNLQIVHTLQMWVTEFFCCPIPIGMVIFFNTIYFKYFSRLTYSCLGLLSFPTRFRYSV